MENEPLGDYKTFLHRNNFQTLIDVLQQQGYLCLGPQVKDGSLCMEPLENVSQLPIGISDEQKPGFYRLHETDTPRCFAWANGAQALKPIVFKAREVLWSTVKNEDGSLQFAEPPVETQAIAVIGVKSCDLAGLDLLDRHYMQQTPTDKYYQSRRDNLFIIAVNCFHSTETCLCASTGDGPEVKYFYDIALSELDDGFLVTSGSEAGQAVLAQLPLTESNEKQRQDSWQEIQQASENQVRKVPLHNMRDLLVARLEHPRWDDVADRCLSCGNCVAVCPTCFCHAQLEEPALDNSVSKHYRQWDTCFHQGHSYIHGIVIRSDTRARYRQWLTHKFGYWHDQYGRSGCIGCGRCITWCPVGIDVTEELAALAGEMVNE